MIEENKQLARRWFDQVWNQDYKTAISAIDAMFHPTGTCGGFPESDSVLTGPEEFKAIHHKFRSAFSNIRVVIEDMVAEGDKVAVLWTATMTHSGDGLGIDASGKQVSLPGSSFLHCSDGRIVAGWNQMDFTRIFMHLQSSPAVQKPLK